jgi:hypothetical protein
MDRSVIERSPDAGFDPVQNEIPQSESGPEENDEEEKKDYERSNPFISLHRPRAPTGASAVAIS